MKITYRHRTSGVTLIEFMLAITLMGIVLGLGMPLLQSVIVERRLEVAAKGLKMNLDLARMRAISEGHDFLVAFSSSQRRYVVVADLDGDGLTDGNGDLIPDDADPVLADIRFPIGVDYPEASPPPSSLNFNSRGTLDSAAAIIKLENSRGTSWGIRVVKSGYVRVES